MKITHLSICIFVFVGAALAAIISAKAVPTTIPFFPDAPLTQWKAIHAQ